MFRVFSIAAFALSLGCQSTPSSRGCFDEGHIRAVTENVVSFCSGTSLEPGSEIGITVPQAGPPRGGPTSFRKRIGTAIVISQNADGIVQARITDGYARTGAHAAK